MKKLFAIILIVGLGGVHGISQVPFASHAGISDIQAAGVNWSCSQTPFNHPPYATTYSGGYCGINGYDVEKLLTIPYWWHCNGGGESRYWIKTWTAVGGNTLEKCYHNGGGLSTDGSDYLRPCGAHYALPLGLIYGEGVYFQIDLYSQCTSCTDQADSGSWWSSKGNDPTQYNAIGFIPAESVNEIYDEIEDGNSCFGVCYDLDFLGSPDCDCIAGSKYGCASGDQH